MPSIFISKSTLMHASLAQLTPEMQTLNDIICDTHSITNSTKIRLPAEILLYIRECLLPIVVAHLVNQSTVALEKYEQSLCDLLCPDCTAYNFEIYGPDIWQWEQFSGACACVPGSKDTRLTRRYIANPPGTESRQTSRANFKPSMSTSSTIPDPRQFISAEHWLEFHLSHELASNSLLQKCRGFEQFVASSATRGAVAAVDIWDVVSFVLTDFKCEALREPQLPAQDRDRKLSGGSGYGGHAASLQGRGQPNSKQRLLVQVVPTRHVGPRSDSNSDSSLEPEPKEIEWYAGTILHRAQRDLGLSLEYAEALYAQRRVSVPTTRRRRSPWTDVPSKSCYFELPSALIFRTLLTLTSLAGACISLPIAFATFALTILCFYSKPRSLRIF